MTDWWPFHRLNRKIRRYSQICTSLSVFGSVRKIAKSNYWLRHVCPSVRPSSHPSAWNNSASTGRSFMQFYISEFFENLSRKFKFHSSRTRIKGTSRDNQYTFWSCLAQFFWEWEMLQTKFYVHGSVHRESMSIICPTRCDYIQFIIFL